MTLKELLEKEEQAGLDKEVWSQRFLAAKAARSAWDTDYEKAAAILSNKVATSGGPNSLDMFTDKMFHTNWLLKLCIWLESYIMSADVYGDLKSHTGSDDVYPDRLLLEMELNRLLARFEMVRDWCTNVVPARIRYGYGVSYLGWNSTRRDQYWRNGKPNFVTLDPRRVWPDASAGGINFKDRRWVFAKIEVSVDEGKMLFPEFADKITESPGNSQEGDPDNRKDRFDYYLCQYHTLKTMRMIDVEVYLNGKSEIHQVPLSQVQDFVEANPGAKLPDNMRIIEEGDPDNPGYDAEFPAVFQFKYSYDLSEILSPVEYVGDVDQFQFWCYHKIDSDIYPRGTAYMLQDEQTIKSILLTKAAVEVIKNGRKTPIAKEGAIKNLDDYIKNHNALDYVAIIDAEWYESHRGDIPIDFIDNKFDPQITAFLNALLKEEMQQLTGGTDSMMGQAQYAGMSAAQTGLLQASGATYTKSDELSYRDYCKDVMECAVRQICDYITYQHTIDGIDQAGQAQTMTVNLGGKVDWDWERYFVEPIIENSPETIKQLKKQEAMQLNSMGAMGPVRMLYELGYNDAERIVAEADERNGILALIKRMQERPELKEKLDAILTAADEAEAQEKSTPAKKKPKETK